MALNAPLMQFVVYVCMILIFWFGARELIISCIQELLRWNKKITLVRPGQLAFKNEKL